MYLMPSLIVSVIFPIALLLVVMGPSVVPTALRQVEPMAVSAYSSREGATREQVTEMAPPSCTLLTAAKTMPRASPRGEAHWTMGIHVVGCVHARVYLASLCGLIRCTALIMRGPLRTHHRRGSAGACGTAPACIIPTGRDIRLRRVFPPEGFR